MTMDNVTIQVLLVCVVLFHSLSPSSPFFTPQNSKLSSKCLMLVVIKPPMEFQPKSEPKRSLKHKSCPSTDHQDLNFSDCDDDNDDSRSRPTKRGGTQPSCQAERCATALSEGKRYHRRHKVCEFHAKAPVAVVAGLRQRFCQQCSRFHELSEFDEAKRSCRRRLAGHNERRRKVSTTSDTPGDGRSPAAGDQCKVATDERVKVEMAHQTGNSTGAAFKHFQMR